MRNESTRAAAPTTPAAALLRPTLALLILLIAAMPMSAADWPSFRGERAQGVADGENIPSEWNVDSGENVLWSREIPGAGHGSPIVSGGSVYLTSAATDGSVEMVLGDERGNLPKDPERSFVWTVYRLNARTGEIEWQRDAFRGKPRANRHPKSSQANATPASDGEYVVALFGSEGVVAYRVDGTEVWRKDLGVLDPGLFGDSGSQWGHASSPTLHEDRVFVQVDRHSDSFIVAYELATGRELWRVERQEKPIWATPTIHVDDDRTQLIVLGGDYDRGFDPATGEELWRFARDLQVKTPTPFVAEGLVILAGGYRGRELYALQANARGTVDADSLVWTSEAGGPYTSTPVAYGDLLFYVRDTGIFNVLELETGANQHRRRLDHTFSASPVASDDRIFLTSEDGVVHVLSTEAPFDTLAKNDMGEPCMSTPAIARGVLYQRCRSQIWAISKQP